jgi:hypothetical protein
MDTKKELKVSESTFLVKIKYRQNSSWQGNVQWVETGKTQNFKSCLELIRLMDMAAAASGEAANPAGFGWNPEK